VQKSGGKVTEKGVIWIRSRETLGGRSSPIRSANKNSSPQTLPKGFEKREEKFTLWEGTRPKGEWATPWARIAWGKGGLERHGWGTPLRKKAPENGGRP